MKKDKGVQMDIYGNIVSILNAKEIYRTVKCGRCGQTVKSSRSKTHLSYGNTLTICKECLGKDPKFHKGMRRK